MNFVHATRENNNSNFCLKGIILTFSVYFSIDLSPEEGGGTVELMPGGKDIEVTSSNVYDYVRKYAKYRMVKAQEKAIQVGFLK